uniref:Uncharacterized protein n=1 Tax=Globodera rostochiensis TaxID=31243 RepID=A0A914HLQ7_GLORO
MKLQQNRTAEDKKGICEILKLPEHRPRHKALALDECVGRHKNSFSYANKGRFWKDGTVDGGNSKFGVEKSGCGVNLATRQIFYALNGKRLYTAKALDCPMDLFLCVSLEEPGDSVETNFGSNFKFNLADEFKELGSGNNAFRGKGHLEEIPEEEGLQGQRRIIFVPMGGEQPKDAEGEGEKLRMARIRQLLARRNDQRAIWSASH